MKAAFQIPDDLGEKLVARWQDLPRSALEALAADADRNEVLTSFEVQRLPGFESRWEADALLKRMGAWLQNLT